MSTKLFKGPKEVNNEVLLAVGYESGHFVLWSVTDAVRKATAAAAAVGTTSSMPYSPPEPLACAKLHSEPIMALDIDVEGYSGVSGSAEDALITFSITYTGSASAAAATIAPTATINIKKQGVGDVALRPDGKLLASAGWDGKIRVYKKSNGKALAVFKYHSASASALEFSPRSFLIASGARDGTVALWDVYKT
jgi:WD40 repeat protein